MSCRPRGRSRSRGARTRDSRGVRPRRIPARAARRLPARRASPRGSPTRSCGGASSRADAARSGGTSRGRHVVGGGFAWETRPAASGPTGGRRGPPTETIWDGTDQRQWGVVATSRIGLYGILRSRRCDDTAPRETEWTTESCVLGYKLIHQCLVAARTSSASGIPAA